MDYSADYWDTDRSEMIRNLGFENKRVILFWKAFEEERWLACELHYKCFEKGLTK